MLTKLYTSLTGEAPNAITPITGSGSNRQYFRLSGPVDVIGVIGESVEENRAFIYLANHLRRHGINVPQVLAVSDDSRCYLQQDLGATSLFDAIAAGRTAGSFSPEETELIGKTIESLPVIQFRGAVDLDFSQCFPEAEFNRRMVMWDLNYFKYCFLKLAGIDFNESRLENDFNTLADALLSTDSQSFMYRDFQSRNVMILNGEPWFIDFQGGRRGPAEYDVASFLWQARANFPSTLRNAMVERYIAAASQFPAFSESAFRNRLPLFVLFRMLQVLGAYGFRGIHERKQHFIDSIPGAARNLLELIQIHSFIADEYPEIESVIRRIADKYLTESTESPEGLTVTITSFSYKKGIPDDNSGNGGGFVFDCRAMHNPGRYDEYKPLTGLDLPVIEFLEQRGEIQKFLANVYNLVDPAVETYLRRGFTSLMVNFGCTGGRHRSVYCAEHLAAHIAARYPAATVRLLHREQHLARTLPATAP